MIRNRFHISLILVLIVGLAFQLSMLPVLGADCFNLSASSMWSGIYLHWTPVSDATSYEIYRSSSSSSKIATVASNIIQYRDYSLAHGKRYTYWIIAKKGNTQLAISNKSDALAGDDEYRFTPILQAKAFSTPYVELTWGSWSDFIRYELERKTGDKNFCTCALLNKETSYKDNNVSRGDTYTYRIIAYTDQGDCVYSDNVTISIKPEGAVPDVPAQFYAYVDRVYQNYTNEVLSEKRIVLSWRYDDDDAEGFKIEKKSLGGNYTEIVNTTTGSIIFNNSKTGSCYFGSSPTTKQYYYYDNEISSDSVYFYRIKAYGTDGQSAYTQELRVATMVTKAPYPPSNLMAAAVPGKINLTWKNNSGNENGLHIEKRADNAKAFSAAGSVSAGVSTWCDTNFSPNTTYFYRVKAYNDKGSSDCSKEASVKSLSAPPSVTTKADTGINLQENANILLLYASPSATSVSRIRFLTTPLIIKSTTTYLPASDIANLFDSAIKWDESENKVTLSYHNQTIECWVQKNTAKINGSVVAMDSNDPTITPFIAEQKYIMLPLQFIERAYKCKIDWQQNDKFINVYKCE